MPEDQSDTTLGLERLLDDVQDYSLQVHIYPILQKALESADNISVQVVKKILLICVCDLKEDIKCSINDLSILCTLLKKIKVSPCSPLPDLVPSAVVVLRILKTTALFNKIETLKILGFEIMGLYPDETLISLVVDQSNELMELFNLYCHQRIPMEIRVQPICLITKFLKILPPDKKATFVKEGLNIWFSKIIPTVINCSTNQHSLEALELLTDELTNIEYADNQHWRNVLACIYTPQKYPAIMKTLLEQGSETWHRLWIVFIKLLKTQITKNTNTVGSPINSMLPVVEMAFKMDIPNRCRAFQCWNVLIDNFATETNAVYVNKRLKLLIIPLSSNNAKVEETALAKLDTWWHLISSFYVKMDKFAQTMLITFLHFCFGKPASDKPVIIPGMISVKTRRECVKVFINLLGHSHCDGCVEYPKLKEKIVNTKLLVSHWLDWIHSLSTALKICTENEFTDEQIKCVWKSFVMTVGELPENNVRRDLFNEVLVILEKVPKNVNNRHVEVIINILIPTLFENNEKIRPLLKTNTEVNPPVIKILTVLLRLPLSDIESRINVNKLRKMTDYLVDDALKSSSHTIEWLLKDLSSNNMLLWIALSESINERLYSSCPRMLCKMLLWPFKYIDLFVKKSQGTSSWLKMYKFLNPMQHLTSLTNDILTTLLALNDTKSSNAFIFDILLALLRTTCDGHQSKKSEDGKLEKEVQLLYKSTSNLDNLGLDSVLPTLSDIIILICNNLNTIEEHTANNFVLTVANILKTSLSTLEKSTTDQENILNYLTKIMEYMEIVFKKDAYTELKLLLTDDLKNLAPFTKDDKGFKRITSAIYKSSNSNDKFTELIKAFGNNSNTDNESKKQSSKDKFPTPASKVTKKNKNKEASIVDTVVENGEEYVVVKSNWKFNPRKLTDNQKEKLQRKREDIPALYQDLSQSQDDYKLATWKSDSMDTSSKSASVQGKDDASTILKNLPNSEFVPKMLENMISKEKATEEKPVSENDSKPKSDEKIAKIVNKETKSPRMALKDRVFRNVRNLIEKSNVSENETTNKTENVSKTPTTTKPKQMVYLINSAPSQINEDRPSRVKRKPKKFDNLQLFGPKKRRCSVGHSDSPSDGEVTDSPVDEFNPLNEPVVNDKIEEDKNDLKDNENKANEKVSQSVTDLQSCKESETPELGTDDGISKVKTAEYEEKNIEVPETSRVITEEKQTDEVLKKEMVEETASQTLDTTLDALDATPKDTDTNKKIVRKTSYKKTTKKSRIEKELAIDMVEGHPFLKGHLEKRSTRKAVSNSPCTSPYTRNNISLKSNRSKSEPKNTPKVVKKGKDLNISIKKSQNTDYITETQDVIESSQESMTTISVKSTKSIGNKSPFVKLEKSSTKVESQKLLDDTKNDNTDTNEDIEFPCNKTAKDDLIDLTDNMDTEPMDECSDVIIINDEDELPIEEDNKNETIILETQNTAEADTQSMDPNMFVEIDMNTPLIDEASSEVTKNTSNLDIDISMTNSSIVATPDELSIVATPDDISIVVTHDASIVATHDASIVATPDDVSIVATPDDISIVVTHDASIVATHDASIVATHDASIVATHDASIVATPDDVSIVATPDDVTKTMTESVLADVHNDEASSSFKDEEQRKKDFLNNTLEISPIKIVSPVRDKKSLSPETSSDYVVVKLSSPVQSNGEPFDKCESPEIFTEDKVSLEIRDASPPRKEISVSNSSPRSSLSLKKHKPPVRSGGRAAQMLGLCVPDRLQTIGTSEKSSDIEETKKSPSVNSSARRNLRILYNSTNGDTNDVSEADKDIEGSSTFLKFERSLPSVDCSPSVPILKRKLAEITDEATVSPASKRKRVSFHDPPVSTTICVKKYIEPCGIRSPQNTAIKRQERQLRPLPVKSPKRLENVFKLDSVLTKTVESFTENSEPMPFEPTEDTEMNSLDQTPTVEIVKTSDLNDTDPICLELVSCEDPISNIATELSSPTMKVLLVKEFEEKVSTVGDLAKMTELEINRLCIKAPKVQVAKKVLNDYIKNKQDEDIISTTDSINESIVPELFNASTEVQTDLTYMEIQTNKMEVSLNSTQTDCVLTTDCSVQTDETGDKTTADIITSCLKERNDFIDNLCDKMDDTSKQKMADNLSFNALTEVIMKKMTPLNSSDFLNRVIQQQRVADDLTGDTRLSVVRDYLCNTFGSKELILFCSDLLRKVHDTL